MAKPKNPRLTDGEVQIITLVAQGYSAPEIGRELGRTTVGINNSQARIRAKLGAKNTTHAAVIAIKQGLV